MFVKKEWAWAHALWHLGKVKAVFFRDSQLDE